MNRRRKRNRFVRIIVGKVAFAAASGLTVAGDVQVVNVFEQIGDEEESVDLVLMFGRFSELVLLVGARFKAGRIVLPKMPCSERGLRERLFCRQHVVDERVRSGQAFRSILSRRSADQTSEA